MNFNEDVKPVLGNPFVVGAPTPRRSGATPADTAFVAAIGPRTGALDDLVDKTKPNKVGEESGAKLYEEDGTASR